MELGWNLGGSTAYKESSLLINPLGNERKEERKEWMLLRSLVFKLERNFFGRTEKSQRSGFGIQLKQ